MTATNPTNHANFPEANEAHAASLEPWHRELVLPPKKKLVVLTCMDARIDPAQLLGLKSGDAHVVRNAGGRASEALRSIVVSQQLLGTTEIAVFHHTDCGMTTFKDDDLREVVRQNPPNVDPSVDAGAIAVGTAVDAIAFLSFRNLEQSVKEDVAFLKENPLVLRESVITGWIHDVKDGRIIRIV